MPTSPAQWEAAAVALRRIYADAEVQRIMEEQGRFVEDPWHVEIG